MTHTNVADYEHEYVGQEYVYLPGMPSMKSEEREDNLILRAGDVVKVVSVFRNWNVVDDLDVLYVQNLCAHDKAPSTHTHITPGDLGLLALDPENRRRHHVQA
jgi:hypothetical protein